MKELKRWAILALVTFSLGGCVGGQRSGTSDEEALTAEADAAESGSTTSSGGDELGDFEGSDLDAAEEPAAAENAAASSGEAATEDEFSLDEPVQEQAAEAAPAPAEDELSLDEPVENTAQDSNFENPPAVAATEEPAQDELSLEPELIAEEPPPPPAIIEPEPAAPEPVAAPEPPPALEPQVSLAKITSLQYRANDTGGTLLIEADRPIEYKTRTNPELRQMVIEIPDAILPKKLQRPLNTKDIQGTIGAIDPYQNSGSNVARFVIQLRPGAPDPVIQQEGNAVMIVANPAPQDHQADMEQGETPINVDMTSSQVLASHSLDDYLSNNTKFYGKKISIEVANMDVTDALRFIMEESGVNMVVSDEVKGGVSLKLRQVPWDQALVVLLKAKSLGYTRQGSVLRIAPLEQLRKEEDEATKLAASRRTVEPLKVRVYPVSYAQVAEMEKKVASFLSERGKVVSDVRTNSLVVTDIADNLERVAQLVRSLDMQPPQVLIEGRIVEAKETFMRAVGLNWGVVAQPIDMGRGPSGPANLRPSLAINPVSNPSGSAILGLTLGTLDGLGDLRATLALNEQEDRVKVISSPRVVTMSNEPAKISQTTEVPIETVTQNGTTTQRTVSYKPLTLLLDVTPQVTAEGSVMMKVQVKREFAGARDVETKDFPINGREANTRVLVRNGETAVIGGIYQSDVREGETGVPWLRDVPYLGALFRGTTTDKDKMELVVFLTPRVLPAGRGGNAPADLKEDL